MMKKYSFHLVTVIFLIAGIASCKKDTPDKNAQAALFQTKQYSGTVATDWITLEADLTRTTTGFGPGPSGRAFGYTGLALYEAVLPGMPSYQSVFSRIAGQTFIADQTKNYYWPAAANAALAQMLRNLFVDASTQNKAAIEQLEAQYSGSFQNKATAEEINRAVEFGKMVANAVFEWSKTDGGVPPFTSYNPTLPVTPGTWQPTPPFFAPGVVPNWGSNRPIIPDVASMPLAPPPTPYSEDPSSAFYKMADTVYQLSTQLTADDKLLVKTWFDIPENYNGQTHFTKVLTQLIKEENFDLEKTAAAFAHHGIAVSDAAIPCFKAKYTFKLVRPITYIRNVLGHPTWNTVVPTPPHPEYTAAHAAIAGASATILRFYFGNNHPFIDHTHDSLYGPRSYSTIDAYEKGAGWSRVLAGVHYIPSVDVGSQQGRTVGNLVMAYPFKKP